MLPTAKSALTRTGTCRRSVVNQKKVSRLVENFPSKAVLTCTLTVSNLPAGVLTTSVPSASATSVKVRLPVKSGTS